MTERAIVCPGCGEAVPYGRLSCPECGTLLASVAGGVRPTVRTAEAPGPDAAAASEGAGVEEPPLDQVADEPPPEPARLRAARKSASAAVAGAYVPPGATTPPPDPPLAPVTSARVGAGALPPPRAALGKGSTQAKAATPAAPPPVAASPSLVAAAAAATEAPADEPAVADAPATSPEPGSAPEPSPGSSETPATEETPASVPFPPATLVAARPASVAPMAGAASDAAVPAASTSVAWAATSSTPAAGTSAAGASDELAWLDPGLDWATVAGAGLIVIGMLLPWSRTVIGATGVGYFDTWGLAGPLHVVVFVWALVVASLSIVRKPAPAWVRSGLAGFALGAFSLGLTWPYLFGPLEARIGVLAVAVGSFVLIATGVLAAWRARHAGAEPSV